MFSQKTIALTLVFCASIACSQEISKLERGRAQDILHVVADDVRKHYYDPKLHGLDWDAKIAEAERKIEQAKSFNAAMSAIAAMVGALDDTHTFFLPPQHAFLQDFGWHYQMIGQHCFVTRVRPKSDAETKGLKPGDEVLSINGFTPDRDTIWTMHYAFSALRPQPVLHVTLLDQSGNRRELDIATKIQETKRVFNLGGQDEFSDLYNFIRNGETVRHLHRVRTAEFGDELLILKLPNFEDLNAVQVADMIGKARKHKTLIMDLRGNPGGQSDILEHFVGGMFDRDVKIGDRVGRKETKPEIAKASHNPFTGKLIVLVDSESASRAELFARTMQIEKRGIVLGDRSAGAATQGREYQEQSGVDTAIFCAISVTEANVIMTDGKSLEHVGVMPDEPLAPSAKSLAANSDPVLARAAELAGVKITGEEAGNLFPYEWPPEP